MASFQALEKNYLRELIFLIYLDPTKPEVIHEKFTFTFSYDEGVITMCLGEGSSKGKKKEVKMEELKGEIQDLLRKLLVVTQGLDKLPDEAYLAIKLTYYDEVTPKDYEPEGFRPDLTKEVPMPAGSYRVSLGRADTGFHAIRLKMDSRQGTENNFVNDSFGAESQSQQQSGETPGESGEGSSQSPELEDYPDTQLPESAFSFSQPDSPASTVSLTVKLEPSSSSSPPGAVVSCLCQNTSLDPLMLVCSTCSTAQHAICYRLLSEEELPALHTCWTCSRENPGLVCTDPKMERFSGREDQAAPTCLFRRVLVLLEGAEGDIVTTYSIQSRLDMSEEEVANLVKRLQDQKVVTDSSGRLLINMEVLRDSKRRFLGIKSKVTKTTYVTSASSSKRKEEEVLESRKKKKSKTDSALQF